MIEASCHCGAIKIEIDRRPRKLTQCTCSICRRYGAVWGYYTNKTARIVAGKKFAKAYTWGDKSIEFYHCNRCGSVTHYESVKKGPEDRFAVNFRMVDPADYQGVRIRTFDGGDTWKYID